MFLDPYDCKGVTTGKYFARSFSRFWLQPPNDCNRAATSIRLQPPNDCNQIRPPYDRHTTVWRSVCGCNLSATSCNQVRPPYDRHTSVWRSVCSSIRLQPICNQIRPPYDRHTSVWRPVCSSIRLQPICNQIRPPYGPPYVCLEVCLQLHTSATYLQPDTTAIRLFMAATYLQPDCNQDGHQEPQILYVIHVIGHHRFCRTGGPLYML